MTWKPNATLNDWQHLTQTGAKLSLENPLVTMEGDHLGKHYKMDITEHYLEIFEQARLWRDSVMRPIQSDDGE